MRLWVFSDLHLPRPGGYLAARDVLPSRLPDADVCICAGDVADGWPQGAIAWLDEQIGAHMPVLLVLGNHEFYGGSITETREAARAATLGTAVTLLDDDVVEIDGVRFVGGTLWTDYGLYATTEAHRRQYMAAAKRGLADHFEIRTGPGLSPLFTPADAFELHLSTRAFIEGQLAMSAGMPAVVVTHHAPHPLSVADLYAGDPLTPAFVSDLSDNIDRHQPALWVHGHTHTVFDYRVGATRVVCNPRGYRWERNWNWLNDMVIET